MKDEKKVNALCIVDHNLERSVVVPDHFRNFKEIQLIVGYNIECEEGMLISSEKETIVQN